MSQGGFEERLWVGQSISVRSDWPPSARIQNIVDRAVRSIYHANLVVFYINILINERFFFRNEGVVRAESGPNSPRFLFVLGREFESHNRLNIP